MLAGKAVPAGRTQRGRIWGRQVWGRRIWLAQSAVNLHWAGHPAEDQCALGHRVLGYRVLDSTDRVPANDWPHKRTEVLAYDREHDREHDRE